MPELPEVEVFGQYIQATSLHKKIVKVTVQDERILENISADNLAEKLKNKSLQSLKRYGKYLFVRISGDDEIYLMLHFGMSGNVKYFRDIEQQPSHMRIRLEFENGYYLGIISQRLLGKVGIVDDLQKFLEDKELGGDALNIDFDTFKELLSHKRGNIKSALMDQHLMAGVGNIYSDEILFQSKIHPACDVSSLNLSQKKTIFQQMKQVLQIAIQCSAEPDNFPDEWLLRNRNVDAKCPRCGDNIMRTKISGRSAYFCPTCQKQ